MQDPRVTFIKQTLNSNGNVPWQSKWYQVPRHMQGKVHRFAKYITVKNYEKYRQREVKTLTFRRLLEQATRGYMGEVAFYLIYGVHNHMMAPDWFVTPDHLWPTMAVNWSPDHGMPPTRDFADRTVGFEDKTGRSFDPGWALQWSTGNRRSRVTANRMPLAYGAVGPNYFLVLMEHQEVNGVHSYRIASIVRGVEVYRMRNFTYKGTPLLGPMANGNKHKKQLTKEVLYNTGMTFYRPAWVQGKQIIRPMFQDEDFPALTARSGLKRKSCLKQPGQPTKRKRVRFDQRPDKIYIIENCTCGDDIEDGEIVERTKEAIRFVQWGDRD